MDYRAEFQSALRSYNAMETTKRRHFEYLTMLETKKKKFNLNTTGAEQEILASLLRDHDEEVRTFKARCDALKNANLPAHAAMFEYLAKVNQALAPIGQANGH
ncbi:MAG: hypothetical protein AAF404_05085 [Pseudomonadota bacterium]